MNGLFLRGEGLRKEAQEGTEMLEAVTTGNVLRWPTLLWLRSH